MAKQQGGCEYCRTAFNLSDRDCNPVSYTEKIKVGRSMQWTTRLFCNNDCMEKFKVGGPKHNDYSYKIT